MDVGSKYCSLWGLLFSYNLKLSLPLLVAGGFWADKMVVNVWNYKMLRFFPFLESNYLIFFPPWCNNLTSSIFMRPKFSRGLKIKAGSLEQVSLILFFLLAISRKFANEYLPKINYLLILGNELQFSIFCNELWFYS